MTATINGTVQFECEATGHPEPTVSWLWNDVPIEAGPRHQLLEGGTVLQVGVPLSRWLCCVDTQETLNGGHGASFPPKGGCPGLTKVPMGATASPQLGAALRVLWDSPQGALLPLCRWQWWRWVTLGVTRAWLRTRPAQLRGTLPSLCRVRHLPFPRSLIYCPPPLSPPTGAPFGSGTAWLPLSLVLVTLTLCEEVEHVKGSVCVSSWGGIGPHGDGSPLALSFGCRISLECGYRPREGRWRCQWQRLARV